MLQASEKPIEQLGSYIPAGRSAGARISGPLNLWALRVLGRAAMGPTNGTLYSITSGTWDPGTEQGQVSWRYMTLNVVGSAPGTGLVRRKPVAPHAIRLCGRR